LGDKSNVEDFSELNSDEKVTFIKKLNKKSINTKI
jgi:hypothetical protein